jgi:hypothetical protein
MAADHAPHDDGLSPAELEAETAERLPDREAMSTLDPTAGLDPAGTVDGIAGTVGGALPAGTGGLLDLDVNVDLSADAAAPINAGVAANANVAAPIDAAVSANVASPDATSAAVASQTSVIHQDLDGVAIADADQTSDIGQGEVATPPADGAPAPEAAS